MKGGLLQLSAFQVASIRIISAAIVLLPVAIKGFKLIPKNRLFPVIMSGVLGSLLPAYLFCVAEQTVSSALAGVLNSLTPIFVIIIGGLFFHSTTSTNKVIGVIIAFTGSVLLFLNQPGFSENSNSFNIMLIVVATVFYGINVNMVGKHLSDIPSLNIVAVAMNFSAIPAFIVLLLTGFFSKDLGNREVLFSIGYSSILGVFGTTVASTLFYMLIKRAGAVFSSMVTYGIPFVAIMWGIIFGEKIGTKEILCLMLILAGVFIANRKKAG